MNWRRGWHCVTKINNPIGTRNYQDFGFNAEKGRVLDGPRSRLLGFQQRFIVGRNPIWGSGSSSVQSKQSSLILSRQFGHNAGNDSQLDRDFLVQLWVEDRKMRNPIRKRRRKVVYGYCGGSPIRFSYNNSLGRFFPGASIAEENSFKQRKCFMQQPPPSQ